jgi:hypothetical protein
MPSPPKIERYIVNIRNTVGGTCGKACIQAARWRPELAATFYKSAEERAAMTRNAYAFLRDAGVDVSFNNKTVVLNDAAT